MSVSVSNFTPVKMRDQRLNSLYITTQNLRGESASIRGFGGIGVYVKKTRKHTIQEKVFRVRSLPGSLRV